MSDEPGKKRRSENDEDPPKKDYLGRILIGFIVAAAVLWALTFIF